MRGCRVLKRIIDDTVFNIIRYLDMAYCIKDKETEEIVRELSKLRGRPIAQCIKDACRVELKRLNAPLEQRVKAIAARLEGRKKTPEKEAAA
jgi:hypothetical protein